MSKAKAITSSVVEHKLGEELKKEEVSAYLLYRIIIETGASYKELLTHTVGFFRDKCLTAGCIGTDAAITMFAACGMGLPGVGSGRC